MKTIHRSAYIVEGKLMWEPWVLKLPMMVYAKNGPATLGDDKYPVPEGYTSIEFFTDEDQRIVEDQLRARELSFSVVRVTWRE